MSAEYAAGLAKDLEGRTAVITGAARGIGLACAQALASRGATVALLDILDAEPAAREIRQTGAQAVARQLDISDRDAVDAAFGELYGELGRCDILVCAAGIYGEVTGIEELDPEEVHKVLSVNLEGTLWCVRAAMRTMTTDGWGRIVVIGSAAGVVGGVLAGPHYTMTKGAVHALVKWAAKAGAAHTILVNGIAPGAVATDMIAGKGYPDNYCPLGRLAQPREIGEVAGFLASPGADYITGQILNVSGGLVL